MVESETIVKPHYVTVTKNGKVTCNDCPGWNAYKICSHSLAVAEKSDRTADYLKWLRTKGPQQMNLTSLTTSDSNKVLVKRLVKRQQQGEREAETPIKLRPPTNVVDRVTCVSTLETVSLSPSTSTNPTCLQPQVGANSLQHSNPSFVNSSFQCNQLSGATHPSMVYAIPSSSQYYGGSSHAYGGLRITFLQLCSPLVRLCYGCSQTLKPGGMIATSPPPPPPTTGHNDSDEQAISR